MLAGQELSFLDTLLIGVAGMAVVMIELILISVMIMIMAKVIRSFDKSATKVAEVEFDTVKPVNDGIDEEHAVIMSVIAEDMKVPLEQLEFTWITQIK